MYRRNCATCRVRLNAAVSREPSMDKPLDKKGLFATKSIADYQEEAAGRHLVRALGIPALIAFGIGGIIGTGIFVLTGLAAAQHAGPAIVISFIIAGIGCMFAGLSIRNSQRWCRCAAAPTPTAMRPSGRSSPGSSAGTWCSST